MSRQTQQRDAIWNAFEATGRPMSPQEVLELAQQAVPGLGLSTVYRNLRKLEEEQRIVPVHVPGQPDRYETSKAASDHHHHFHCDSCGKLFDITGCPGGLKQLLPKGFVLKGHEISMHGQCADCNHN
jgi:Fur family transcriptional regulator, ferric uptake regulator